MPMKRPCFIDLQRQWRPTTFRWLPRTVPPLRGRLCFCLGATSREMAEFGVCSCEYHARVGVVIWERVRIK